MMETKVCEDLCYLRQKERHSTFRKRLEAVEEIFHQLNDEPNILKQQMLVLKFSKATLLYAVMVQSEKYRRKNMISKIMHCDKNLIVWDENELKDNSMAQYVTGSLQYSITTPQESLGHIKLVWDDFNVSALKEPQKLSNLCFVGGDFTSFEDTLPPSLAYVVGDIHIEKADLSTISQLKFVGGDIYCNGKKYTYAEALEKINIKCYK